MFKMFSCKDMSKIECEERSLSANAKLSYKLHLFMCKSCRHYIKQMKHTRDSFKKLIVEKSKVNKELVSEIEKEVIQKFTKK